MAWMTRTALLAASFGLAAIAGCLVDLESRIACGDGFVDAAAGESCDPADPTRAFASACIELGVGMGEAQCNPQTCQIEVNASICAFCGDGVATGDEECDGQDLRGNLCPAGDSALTCRNDCTLDRSLCETCGDGVFDPSLEECETRIACDDDDDCPGTAQCDLDKGSCGPDSLAQAVACSGLSGPPGLGGTYVSGLASDCTDSCKFDRQHCSFCGDEELDDSYQDLGPDGQFTQPAEVCDGDVADEASLVEYCQDVCTNGNGTLLTLRCDYQCEDDCSGFSEIEYEEPVEETAACCVPGGERCDVEDGFPCCWALDHPDDAENACQTVSTPEGLQLERRCRSN